MAVVSHKCRIVYYPIPKNACTTLKHWMYMMDNGGPFVEHQSGKRWISIHNIYPSVEDGGHWGDYFTSYFSFTIIREPIARFVSGYKNRVLHHRDIEKAGDYAFLRQHDLPAVPDVEFFVKNLSLYMKSCASIRHHFLPQYDFVANVVDRVLVVGAIADVGEIVRQASRHSGKNMPLTRMQTGGSEVEIPPLSDEALAMLQRRYRQDFALIRRFGLDREHRFPMHAASA